MFNVLKWNIEKLILCLLLLLSFTDNTSAQQKTDTTKSGEVKGWVKDSTYNFMLTSATVAIYKANDSSIARFTLTDQFGEFKIEKLPLEINLRLIISYSGYEPVSREFLLSHSKSIISMDTLHLHSIAESGKLLEEVIIIPPIQMKGDTLEFNADAFILDSNATAEDLMRRLPGFTIWGDGEVTFNGKKLEAIYVNGKSFLGKDMANATQNLPKEIINKVQVFQRANDLNPYDSTMFANIKLKSGKDFGYFGKLSFGIGNENRYASDAIFSKYNKKTQLSIVGAGNNVNKVSDNIDDLIKSSSFSAKGANIGYVPDFSMTGVNRPINAGIKWYYDFLPDVSALSSRKHRINADYYLNHNTSALNSNLIIKTALGDDSLQTQNIKNTTNINQTQQSLKTTYEKTELEQSYIVDLTGNITSNKILEINNTAIEITGPGIIGTSFLKNESDNADKDFGVRFKYQRYRQSDLKKRIPTNFAIEYTVNTKINDQQLGRTAINTSFIDSTASSDFNRHYDKSISDLENILSLVYPGLKRLIFGKHADLKGIGIKFSNTISLQTIKNKQNVSDFNKHNEFYEINQPLTNRRVENSLNYMPSIGLTKNFSRRLTQRYYKFTNINLNLRSQYYNRHSEAIQQVQNYQYNYYFFVPDASIEFNNHQYGRRQTTYTINFKTQVNYPSVEQIAPLVDSSNFWYLALGNERIIPEIKREINLQYSFKTRTSKNPLNINLSVLVYQKENAFSDSIMYDNNGRQFIYSVNINGNRAFKSDFMIKKSFQKKENTFQVQLQNTLGIYRLPQYVNSIFNVSQTTVDEVSMHFDYSYRDKVALKIQHGQSFYVSFQRDLDNSRFKSHNSFTRIFTTLQLKGKLLAGSDFTYNKNRFGDQSSIQTAIWNANLTYRFLKGQKGEFKLSALDLLRQNRNIVNNVMGNVQTFKTTNVLQQYFMITFSYYPRKFGL